MYIQYWHLVILAILTFFCLIVISIVIGSIVANCILHTIFRFYYFSTRFRVQAA